MTGLPAGSSATAHDLDGRTTIRSVPITLPSGAGQRLTFRWLFAHAANSSSADRFRAIVDDGVTQEVVFERTGSASLSGGLVALGVDQPRRLGRPDDPAAVRGHRRWRRVDRRGRDRRRAGDAPGQLSATTRLAYRRAVDTDWHAEFEKTYTAPPSRVGERIWREVFGDEYPDGIDPFSYISRTELARFARELRVGAGDRLVDVGCGRGGAGLWEAAATGARLLGIDIAEAALEAARERAAYLRADATFRLGAFEATGLNDGTIDAVMSVDALLFTPDKAAAMAELRRILRPGGRLVLTSWDYHAQPTGRPPQVPDHRPIAEAAGFAIVAYEDTEDWRNRVRGTTLGMLEAVDELAAEDDEPVADVRVELEQMLANCETMTRRFLLVADAVQRA